jgi:hypothetical protein
MGAVGYVLRFANITRRPCQLGGWARITAIQGRRKQVLTHATYELILTRDTVRPHRITLFPGSGAYIAVGASILTRDGTLCSRAFSRLQVALPVPGHAFAIHVRLRPYSGLPGCTGLSATPLLGASQVMKQYRVTR